VVAPVSDAADRLTRSWSAAATDLMAAALGTCRSLKGVVRPRPGDESYRVILGPSCQEAWTGPGAVQVPVQRREQETVPVNQPVRVHRAVPTSVPLLGPRTASVTPEQIPAGQDRVRVSIDLPLDGGLYLGRVDDAKGGGTPFLIYLDDLP
jgi:hypothetical protein